MYKKDIRTFRNRWLEIMKMHKKNKDDVFKYDLEADLLKLGLEYDEDQALEEIFNKISALNCIIDDINDEKVIASTMIKRWRYFKINENQDEFFKVKNHKPFLILLNRLIELLSGELLYFKGEIKKIEIKSNDCPFFNNPKATKELIQKLSLTRKGNLVFKTYDNDKNLIRDIKKRVSQYKVEHLFSTIESYYDSYETLNNGELYVCDVGNYEIKITNSDNLVYEEYGPLCLENVIDGEDLSDLVREVCDIDKLWVFDGDKNNGRIDKIELALHHSLFACDENETEPSMHEYDEELIIDRVSQTILHRNFASNRFECENKCFVPYAVEQLLDSLYDDNFLRNVKGNGDDAIYNPDEKIEYNFKIYTKGQRVRHLEGTFDKNGLPDDYGEFAEKVLEFMLFFGQSELLMDFVYKRSIRHKNDYIYVSVEFEDDGQTYYYRTKDEDIDFGDLVIVPVGPDNIHKIAEIVNIEYFTAEEVPLAISKTKEVIRKCNDDDFNQLN